MKIGQVIQQSRGELISQPQSRETSHLATRSKYPTISDFCKVFNPSLQAEAIAHPYRALFSPTAPTLQVLADAYGDAAPIVWLKAQLYELGEFAGVRGKMDIGQIEQTARLIYNDDKYRNWRVTDLMIFFAMAKKQELGEFYGVVDPMKILGMLKQYCIVRRELQYTAHQQKEEREREESMKNCINRTQWEAMKEEYMNNQSN